MPTTHLVANLDMSICQAVKGSRVGRPQMGVNVVPQDCKTPAPEADQLVQFGFESSQVISRAVCHVQARADPVVKYDVIFAAPIDKNLHLLKFLGVVLLPPKSTVLDIVFGRCKRIQLQFKAQI